jgi:hypothetical protein
MENSFEVAREKYPKIPDLDLHYYRIKGHGISDERIKEGRPKFHLIDESKLFSVVPLISSPGSPYRFEEDALTYNGKELPFRVKNIGRIGRNPAYFYYRGIQEWMPTLDSETILSINFQPVCKGCDWCCREIEKGMRNISPEEGVKILQKEEVDLANVDKMTFVTGMYRNGEEVVDNILRTVDLTKGGGFNGRVLYIGAQIQEPSLVRSLIQGLGKTPFKYAYTLETFTQRERMHTKKNGTLEEVLSILGEIKNAGVEDLEYSYMPGLDSMDSFYEWMPKFSRLARPHLSIFRPAEEGQENLKDPRFIEDPIEYLCLMRLAFEKEHDGPIYQNNLASLWGFPKERINPLFFTDKTSLG